VGNRSESRHQKQLAESVKALFKEAGINNDKVVFAIPESSVFTRLLELPNIKEDELEGAVYYQAKQLLPIPIEDVQMSYLPLGHNDAKNAHDVLFVAAPTKIVDIYKMVADYADLDLLAIETESIAVGRAVYKSMKHKDCIILDFGAQSTDMSIMSDGNLVFSQSIAIGSDSLTQALVNQYNFDYAQAEQYKRNYGLIQTAVKGKIFETLKPIVDMIFTEVKRGIEFYKSHTLQPAPSLIILSGDGALLPGLDSYITQDLSIKSELADPWKGIEIPGKFKDIVEKVKPAYVVSVGLSMKLRG
jgi:type IV pilus assembly protein PilM